MKFKNQCRIALFLILAFFIMGCQDLSTVTTISPSVQPTARITATEFGGSVISSVVPTVIPPTPIPALPTQTPTKSVPLGTATSFSSPTLAPSPTAISPLKVHFIDVGQGDAILIQAPDGTAGLIDGGEPNTGVVAYLLSQGIKRLSLVVATHPHSDHIGGLVQVLQTFPVDKVVMDGETYTTTIFEQFIDAIASDKAQFVEVKRGDTISFGGLNFAVLNSGGMSTDDMNQNSVVLRMTYAKTTFLFMGDAGKVVEPMLAGMDISADILKVGHHGSNTASGLSFLSQVMPKVAIYMAGLGNSYGHPAAATIANLKAVGAQIYGTDVNGTIIVTMDGSGYSIKTAKQGNPQAPPTAQPQATTKATVAAQTTPQPTKSGGTGSLAISVVSLTSPISKGATETLTIKTLPGASCTITVNYKSGPSSAAGLGPKTADSSGNVSWSWKVGSSTTAGIWSIVVTFSLNGQQASQTIPFTVQ